MKDLIARGSADGGQILFEAEAVEIEGIDSEQPKIHFKHRGTSQTIDCDFIAGCDGFHGICRPAIAKVLARCSTANIRSAGSAFWRMRSRSTTN